MISWRFAALSTLGTLLYYALLEGVWGATLGKRLCGLRVVGRNRSAPGILWALLRAFIVEALPASPFLVFTYVTASGHPTAANGIKAIALAYTNFIFLAALFCTVCRPTASPPFMTS